MAQKISTPKTRQQAIDLANSIKEIRKNKFKNEKINIPVLLRLRDMPSYKREPIMERLVKEGYARNVNEIKQMLRSKELAAFNNIGIPTESTGMSDDILDSSIQYLNINKEFL